MDCDPKKLGYVGPMADWEMDPIKEKVNPEATDGAYIGASRGHLFKRWAQFVGMPRTYGYGASMGAWVLDYLAGWAGEWGLVVHCNAQYRGPAFTGDITIQTGEVIDKLVDEQGRKLVQVSTKMANQNGTTLATAKAEIELPAR
jgi:hypothetical protein